MSNERESGDPGVDLRPDQVRDVLEDDARLAVLRRSAILGTPAEESFDRLARLASRVLSAPVALVSLVDTDHQFFKSCVGLPAPWSEARRTPLSHSFCQYAVATGEPLIISDATEHPLVHANLAIPDLNVRAYAGIPLIVEGATLGSFCVIDSVPREWTASEIENLRDLAGAVTTEIELRLQMVDAEIQAQQLAASERELRVILRSTGEGIYGLDTAGCCTFVNRAALRMLGYDEETELLGRNMHQAIHHSRPDGSPYPEADCSIARAAEAPGVVEDEVFWRRDGSALPVSYAAFPREGVEGGGAVVSFRDITERLQVEAERGALLEAERKAREAAERSVRAREEVTAIVSHDLRSPAGVISTAASFLLEADLSEEKRGTQLRVIRRAARQMIRLIGDLLDVSKIESGHLTIAPGPVAITSALDEARGAYENAAREQGIDLVVETAESQGRPLMAYGDADRIQQILGNLVSNALRFTPSGGTVRLAALPTEDGAFVRFTVADTGAGIAPGDLEHVFDRFWQARRSDRAGAGLGLAIVRGLVEAHGGSITVSSAPGSGATFEFTIPAAGPDHVSPMVLAARDEQL